MKNVEYQDNIAEVGEVIKTNERDSAEISCLDKELSTAESIKQDHERLIAGMTVPVMSTCTLYMTGKCETQEININHEISEKIIEYIKCIGEDAAFIIITYKFGTSLEENELLQTGMLAEIKGLFEEQDKTRSILLSPIKMVRYKKLETQHKVIAKNADMISVFLNSELFLAEIEEIKYRISDIKKLKKLVQQGRNIALNSQYGNLYIGNQEWRINLELENIVRTSELLAQVVRSSTYNDELAAILYNPNLNQRFEEIIGRIKKDIEGHRQVK